jgi:hypothetical protein
MLSPRCLSSSRIKWASNPILVRIDINNWSLIVWYLMLRIAFFVMHTPVVLKIVSICTAFAGVAEFKKAIGDENYEIYLLN